VIKLVKTVNFPEVGDGARAQLVFVRKYRQNKVTRYIFYRANIQQRVSNELKTWLLDNVVGVSGRQVNDYNTAEDHDYEHVDLNDIDNWSEFNDKAFALDCQEIDDIAKIKTHLIAFMVYIQQNDGIVGTVRRITSGNLLDKTGVYALFLDDSSFSDIKEEKGVRVDKYSDLVFHLSGDTAEGVIKQKWAFNTIFDIYEQQKRESVELLETCTLLDAHPNRDDILSLVQEDRQVQRMLMNPLVREHMGDVDFETMKQLKTEIPEVLSFDIDEANQQVLFPEENRKQAVHDFIKVIALKYWRSLDRDHIAEATPAKFVK